MAYLLDTHVLLWAAVDSPKLPRRSRTLLTPAAEDIYFSAANIWEIVIKSALGRPDFRVDGERLRTASLLAGYLELPIRGAHVLRVAELPDLHRDPFDRILLAQAGTEDMELLTVDQAVLAYGAPASPA